MSKVLHFYFFEAFPKQGYHGVPAYYDIRYEERRMDGNLWNSIGDEETRIGRGKMIKVLEAGVMKTRELGRSGTRLIGERQMMMRGGFERMERLKLPKLEQMMTK